MRDPQRCLVKNDISSLHQRRHQSGITNIALHQTNGTIGSRVYEVLRPATHHIVERDDLRAVFVTKEIHDMRADKSRPSGHQNAFPF